MRRQLQARWQPRAIHRGSALPQPWNPAQVIRQREHQELRAPPGHRELLSASPAAEEEDLFQAQLAELQQRDSPAHRDSSLAAVDSAQQALYYSVGEVEAVARQADSVRTKSARRELGRA